MAEPSPVVEARQLSVYYWTGRIFAARRWVAGPVDLVIRRNEFVGLAGPSGSGKTSIGKALLNLIPTWVGEVYWNGRNVRQAVLRPLRRGFGWISQEPTLAFNPRRRIRQTLEETLAVNGLSDQGDLLTLCDWMNLDPCLLDRRPFELSAGQIQRLALVRALMLKPEFVVLDEVTSSLDPVNQMRILDRLIEWRRRYGLSALFIAHSRRLLGKVADRVVQLRETR
jgi:ABC-type dipeptide/oligopeptide/nickel transport system ATPase subunit